jgi:arsenate reductase
MSEGLFLRAAAENEGGPPRHEARSAGTTPAERVHPEVVEAMEELGIDLSGRVPRRLSRDDAEWADVVVTMGCGDECPYIPGKRYLDWDLPDPKGLPLEEVRRIRDEIARRVDALAAELDATPGASAHEGTTPPVGRPETPTRFVPTPLGTKSAAACPALGSER